IYNSMIQEKETYLELQALQPQADNFQEMLSNLTSSSRVATWRLFYYVVAFCVWTLEKLMDKHKQEIDYTVANNHYGNRTWYEMKAKEFQLGEDLIVVNGVIKYAAENLSKRIVKYAASVPGSVTQVKIAGESGGELIKIPAEQVVMVQNYFNKIKPFGTRVSVTSNEADRIKIIADIYYNPLVLYGSGAKITDGSKPVDVAINNFLKTIEYNGKLNIQKLVDAIQNAEGVQDVNHVEVYAKYGTTEYMQVNREYFSYAGWMRVDTDFPLSATLNFVAYV
ncbi:MAG TPA: hypothetical protein PLS12_10085, partial [Bacteroidales bacterium]|nr:hypothetical protein [Bacteroidales bacterium]